MTSDPIVIGFLLALGMCLAVALALAIAVVVYLVGGRIVENHTARAFSAEVDRFEERQAIEEVERLIGVRA